MCTIMTIDRTGYTRKVRNRIWTDATHNSDGMSLLLFLDGEVTGQLRTMDATMALTLLDTIPWDRMFLHCRLATQGDVTLPNTHGWHTNGVYYMHNGYISDRVADQYEVDSQAIGHWLRRGGVRNALAKLETEAYANVFLIDAETWDYTVHRSRGGSLFTDGAGNYSTNAVGRIRKPVADGEQLCWNLPPMHTRPAQKPAETATTTPNAADSAADATIPALSKDEQPVALTTTNGFTEHGVADKPTANKAVLVQRYDANTGLPLTRVITSDDLMKKAGGV